MKASKVFLNISSVVCFLYGALYIFSLIFIPIGIYCFISARRFSFKAENIFDDVTIPNKVFRNYVIFVSIFCLPFGLLSIIPYVILTGNNIKVKNAKQTELSYTISDVPESNNDSGLKEQTKTDELNSTQKITGDEAEAKNKQNTLNEESYEEKIEKFKKLENFKEKGLITDEELEQARKQLFGEKDS